MIKSNLPISEFFRYSVAGGLAFVADFTTFFVLTEVLQINYLVSNTLGFVVGLTINYLIAVAWVFSIRKYSSIAPEFSLYAVIGVISVALGNACMWYLVEQLHVGHIYAKYAITALMLVFNYSTRKYFIFRIAINNESN